MIYRNNLDSHSVYVNKGKYGESYFHTECLKDHLPIQKGTEQDDYVKHADFWYGDLKINVKNNFNRSHDTVCVEVSPNGWLYHNPADIFAFVIDDDIQCIWNSSLQSILSTHNYKVFHRRQYDIIFLPVTDLKFYSSSPREFFRKI